MQNEKAKRFFSNALLQLMERKPYKKISVREICETAYRSRVNFYKHFRAKDELLRWQIRSVLQNVGRQENGPFSGELWQLAGLTETLCENEAYFQLLGKQGLLDVVPPVLAELLFPGSGAERSARQESFTLFFGLLYALRCFPGTDCVTLAQTFLRCLNRVPAVSQRGAPAKSGWSRQRRNRAALENALPVLLAEAPLGEVAVTELTERAGVNRSSFYRYYPSARAMLRKQLEQMMQAELCTLPQAEPETLLRFYAAHSQVLQAAWRELSAEGIIEQYNAQLNTLSVPLTEDMPEEQLTLLQLERYCFAVRRAALQYQML